MKPADRLLSFNADGAGVAKPLVLGIDTAWFDLGHFQQAYGFAGKENIDVVRVSYFTDQPLVNGALNPTVKARLDARLAALAGFGRPMALTMNNDSFGLDPSFGVPGNYNPVTWAANIAATIQYYEAAGHKVTIVTPCNECDNGSNYGTNDKAFQAALNAELRKLPQLRGKKLSTSTLNTDQALPWYSYLRNTVDVGLTHQLAGSFDNYAAFFQQVKLDGKDAANDEMHNIMEGMVGAEYGMGLGIYWGEVSLSRGEFVKATRGVRLGYAEHRPNWTAASVYRQPNGLVQLFGGASERQAKDTRYQVVSLDHDVFYRGRGPTREYNLFIPGGTGYQVSQENSEQVVNISWGDDVPPAIDTQRYVIVNKNSGKVLEVAGGGTANGTIIQQSSYTGALSQQWDVLEPDPATMREPNTYLLTAAHSGKVIDVNNSSSADGAKVQSWTTNGTNGSDNQRWYFDYAGDGWFRICSAQFAKCLEVANSGTADGAQVWQWQVRNTNNLNQLWRLLPVGAPIKFDAPAAPTGLVATANPRSVILRWVASTSSDVSGYVVLRATSANGPYNTIARNVTTTAFVDNTVTATDPYFYQVQAVDRSVNRSARTAAVQASPTGAASLVVHLAFDGNADDSTVNQNHAAVDGLAGIHATYVAGPFGSALSIAGNDYLQLPYTATQHQSITVATWVKWNGGAASQRIFDFGNGAAQSMYLTPLASTGNLRFGIKAGGQEQFLEASALPVGQWAHVAVTLDRAGAHLYVNGALVKESAAVTLTPMSFKPVLNYIGRSQVPTDPLLGAQLDDFVIYNYALSQAQIAALMTKGVQ